MWFSRRRKRRRHEQLEAMHAQLREADAQQAAGVDPDPEYAQYIARIRVQVAEWRASAQRAGYR